MKPGASQSRVISFVSIILVVVIFIIDLTSATVIRLHVLYIFPLVAISLHSNKISLVLSAVALATLFQLITFYVDGIPFVSLVVDLLISFFSAAMAVILARAVRNKNFELATLSTTDWLTGLNNRRNFETIGNFEIERQKRYGGMFSLAVIDLDGFKKLNDSMGHHVGDVALKLLSTILQEHSRQPDTFARLGGDEFAILMPNTSASDCESLCRALISRIASQMAAASFPITASIGYTSFEYAPESISAALKIADIAMYAAKSKGKNRVASL
jgi:diguanylate cyclase (GGDEF)-like protein